MGHPDMANVGSLNGKLIDPVYAENVGFSSILRT